MSSEIKVESSGLDELLALIGLRLAEARAEPAGNDDGGFQFQVSSSGDDDGDDGPGLEVGR